MSTSPWSIPESVNFRTATALKPLRSATTISKLEIMRYLLSMGADPEQTGGQLPCLYYRRSLDAIRILIENGASPDPPNQGGDTLETLRQIKEHFTKELKPAIEYMLEHIDVESKILAGEADKCTLLFISTHCGFEKLAQNIMETYYDADEIVESIFEARRTGAIPVLKIVMNFTFGLEPPGEFPIGMLLSPASEYLPALNLFLEYVANGEATLEGYPDTFMVEMLESRRVAAVKKLLGVGIPLSVPHMVPGRYSLIASATLGGIHMLKCS